LNEPGGIPKQEELGNEENKTVEEQGSFVNVHVHVLVHVHGS
jgi:hypothetical protein